MIFKIELTLRFFLNIKSNSLSTDILEPFIPFRVTFHFFKRNNDFFSKKYYHNDMEDER